MNIVDISWIGKREVLSTPDNRNERENWRGVRSLSNRGYFVETAPSIVLYIFNLPLLSPPENTPVFKIPHLIIIIKLRQASLQHREYLYSLLLNIILRAHFSPCNMFSYD